MRIIVCQDSEQMGAKAAGQAADVLRTAIATQGRAALIVATGASQFTVLAKLVAEPDLDWKRVTGFHLDEYIGMSAEHPASFRRYLKERFVEKVPIGRFYFIDGESPSIHDECQRVSALIAAQTIDVALVGIGENGHLAFNDPPADFVTEQPYIIVELDDDCRRQQHGEAWFSSLHDVPHQAVSMSIRQILKSKVIVCSVPDLRKAQAVALALKGPVTPSVPASILQQHPNTTIYLDPPAASKLDGPTGIPDVSGRIDGPK